jgi:hypothetical protein
LQQLQEQAQLQLQLMRLQHFWRQMGPQQQMLRMLVLLQQLAAMQSSMMATSTAAPTSTMTRQHTHSHCSAKTSAGKSSLMLHKEPDHVIITGAQHHCACIQLTQAHKQHRQLRPAL